MKFKNTMDIYVTNHARKRANVRKTLSFEDLFSRDEIELFEDNHDNTKFYLNCSDGFVVLKRVAYNRLLIITVVTHGKIDNRQSHRIENVRLFL